MQQTKLKKQSIQLKFQIDKQLIYGKTLLSFLLKNIEKNQKKVSIVLVGKQFQIDSIHLAKQYSSYRIINYEYPDPQIQANYIQQKLERPLSLENYLEIMNSNQILNQKYTESQIIINIEILEKPDPRAKNYIEIEIDYHIENPLAGICHIKYIRNLQNLNVQERYYYTENYLGSTRFWVPTIPNKIYFIKELHFIIPKTYQCVCSGQFKEEVVEEQGHYKQQVYQIDQKIDLQKIGFVIGQFNYRQLNQFYIFYNFNNIRNVNQTLELVDHFISSYIRNYFENFGKTVFKFVFLPGIAHDIRIQQKCLSFLDLALVDEFYMLDEKEIDSQQKNKREIFRCINQSLLERIQLQNPSQDEWIFTGFNNFLADQFSINSEIEYKKLILKLLKVYRQQIENGEEMFVLNNENMGNNILIGSLQQANDFYQLKCRLIFHMMTSFVNCKKQIAKMIFTKTSLNTESFIKAIKHQFGVKKLNFFMKQFIKSTGMPRFQVSYEYHRKENKLQFIIKQKSIQEEYFKKQLLNRIKICKQNNIDCEILEQIINDNKLAIPIFLKSLKYFYGKMNICICETNEIDYKEENHGIHIDAKEENKILVHCRGKFRKTAQKKVTEFDEDLNSVKESSIHSGNLKKTQLFQMNNTGRNPTLWVKFDPENEYLQINEIDMPENILLLHIIKEKNGSVIFRLLDTLMSHVTYQSCNTLCSLYENKELDINLKIYISKMLLKFCQLGAGWRGFEILYNNLKQIQFEDEKGQQLKPNDFSNISDYKLKVNVIKNMSKIHIKNIEDQKYYQRNFTELILKFISLNDNSQNQYNDHFYLHILLQSILKLKVENKIMMVLKEVIKCLNSEIASEKSNNVILVSILNNLPGFLSKNDIDTDKLKNDPFLKANMKIIRQKIKYLLKSQLPFVQAIYFKFKLNYKEKIKKQGEFYILIYGIRKIEQIKEQYLHKNVKILDSVVTQFYYFVKERQERIQTVVNQQLNRQQQTHLAEVLWEQLTSGMSQISSVFRLCFMKIYRMLYFYFVPVCYLDNNENSQKLNMYQIDLNWLQEESQRNQLEQLKPNKIITLQQLNLCKKKKNETDKYKINIKDLILGCFKTSSDQINWKSLAKSIINILLTEKTTENIEKDQLSEEIEQKDDQAASLGFVIKLKSQLNLRVIKKQILREYYDNLDQVEEEVLEVIHNYRKNEWLANSTFQEYLLLIETLFQEAKNILKEKARQTTEKFDQKIMINFQDLMQQQDPDDI